ncbi:MULTISPECIES: hypothetical protein [Sphingomonas]|uniref:hypothetical protein n=1 Tax=Sphingomonas TaxID=13687 RepID=UPI002FC30089
MIRQAGWLDRTDGDLIAADDVSFKHNLDCAKCPDRHDSEPAPHRAACLKLSRPLEERLSANRCPCGDAMGLADAAILPFVRQFAVINRCWFDTQPLSLTGTWLNEMVSSALFDAAMVRLPP